MKRKKPKKARPAPKPKAREDVLSEVIREVAGEDVLPLAKALKNKKNVSEFKLAESIKKEINLTRNMLYRLYDKHLVTFIRKKDKKKGWYIYYWTFNPRRVKELVRSIKKSKIEKLKERLAREQSTNFFSCPNKCIRLDFDQATEFEYKCPECGEILHQEDNSKIISELEKEIQKIEKELNTNIK
ncbi:MAG: transcription factor [Candidatus Woesearchaeota archaeon]